MVVDWASANLEVGVASAEETQEVVDMGMEIQGCNPVSQHRWPTWMQQPQGSWKNRPRNIWQKHFLPGDTRNSNDRSH